MAVSQSLMTVYNGWDGYQTSLVRAIAPRSREELLYRSMPDLRSVGEIAGHISFGRIEWFHRMQAPGSDDLAEKISSLRTPGGLPHRSITENADELVKWLESSWQMVEKTLTQWTVDDLAKTYIHSYLGKTYTVSRQWTIWRIMTHDIQHGGQLTILLYNQGINIPELGHLGGHLTEPPLAKHP